MPRAAGRNVRLLALYRRVKAIGSIFGAVVLVLVPFFAQNFMRSLPSTANVAIPAWSYLACFAFAGLLILQATYLLKRAKHADQGAKGEEEIAEMLTPLKKQGWQIEYGISDRQVGDVDVFLLSPKGQAFTIDVKSHRGYVYSRGEQLYRKRGQSNEAFEKDFLRQAKRQAVAMKQQKRLSFVTPMIAFSTATVEVGENPIAGVYVLDRKKLLGCLRSLG
jgi:hypothetical protein